MCVKQLPADYETRFGYSPLIAETFVDRQSYAGTCYKAANWQLAGQTKGRGRNDLVLVVQDATDLNYSALNRCEGLGLG